MTKYIPFITLTLLLTFTSIHAHAGESLVTTKVEALNTDSLDLAIEKLDSDMKAFYNQLEEANKRSNEEILEQDLKNNERNLDRFIQEQNAQKKKNSNRLWIKVGLLAIIVIGYIIRKRKKPKEST